MISDIEEALNAQAALIPGRKAWQGIPFRPDGEPYMAVSMPFRGRQVPGVGAEARAFWNGVFQILVCNPAREGVPGASRAAEVAAGFFKRGHTLILGAARVHIEQVNLPAPVVTADYISVPVQVSWFCEDTPS